MKFEALNQYAKQTVDSRPGHQEKSTCNASAFFNEIRSLRNGTSIPYARIHFQGRAGACSRRG